MRLLFTHFQQILNQNHIEFSCVPFCYHRMTEWYSYSILVRSKWWKHPSSLTRWTVISHSVSFVIIIHVLTTVFNNDRFFRASHVHYKMLPSVSGLCIFVNMCMTYLPFQTTALRLLLMLACVAPHFNFSVLVSKSSGIPLWFCLTVPQQLICLVCKASNKYGEEMNLSL